MILSIMQAINIPCLKKELDDPRFAFHANHWIGNEIDVINWC